jgi:hypothetical protein
MNKKSFLKKKEIQSFIKCWLYNTKEELDFYSSNDEKIKIKNKDLISFYQEFLNAYEKNRTYKIFGVDIMRGFEISLASKEDLLKISQEIWDNPKDFYEYDGNDYYNFLKYLWINFGNDNDIPLSDIVKTGTEDIFEDNSEKDFNNLLKELENL